MRSHAISLFFITQTSRSFLSAAARSAAVFQSCCQGSRAVAGDWAAATGNSRANVADAASETNGTREARIMRGPLLQSRDIFAATTGNQNPLDRPGFLARHRGDICERPRRAVAA